MVGEKAPMLGRAFRLDTSAGCGKRAAAHQVGGDRVSDALSQVEAVGDDGL
jgi:hypothetical protein